MDKYAVLPIPLCITLVLITIGATILIVVGYLKTRFLSQLLTIHNSIRDKRVDFSSIETFLRDIEYEWQRGNIIRCMEWEIKNPELNINIQKKCDRADRRLPSIDVYDETNNTTLKIRLYSKNKKGERLVLLKVAAAELLNLVKIALMAEQELSSQKLEEFNKTTFLITREIKNILQVIDTINYILKNAKSLEEAEKYLSENIKYLEAYRKKIQTLLEQTSEKVKLDALLEQISHYYGIKCSVDGADSKDVWISSGVMIAIDSIIKDLRSKLVRGKCGIKVENNGILLKLEISACNETISELLSHATQIITRKEKAKITFQNLEDKCSLEIVFPIERDEK